MAIARYFSYLLSAVLLAASLSAPVLAQSVTPLSGAALSGAAQSDPKVETYIVEGRSAEAIEIITAQGSFQFTAEIADTPEESSRGLMFRETMPPTHGMLFDFGDPRLVTMWMKNTPLSLDMVFLSRSGEVAHIAERTKPFSEDIISSGGDVSAVLEINAGVSKLIGLKVGDRLKHRFFTVH